MMTPICAQTFLQLQTTVTAKSATKRWPKKIRKRTLRTNSILVDAERAYLTESELNAREWSARSKYK